jgi:Ca2+-binding EF-hand superfamily protein
MKEMFEFYDADSSGALDYKEFAGILLRNQGGHTRKKSPGKTRNVVDPTNQYENLCEKFRKQLASRGGRGILGIARQFKIADDDNSKALNLSEFTKAMRDFRVNVTTEEIRKLYDFLDRDGNGTINYDEFLYGVRGPMNAFRKAIVMQAFEKLDKDGSGIIELVDIKGVYDASQHPEVKQRKKTEDEILTEFLETFEMNHDMTHNWKPDVKVTKDEFIE